MDVFGLTISQGALGNMFQRASPLFAEQKTALRCAPAVASDETGVRIEGVNHNFAYPPCASHARADIGSSSMKVCKVRSVWIRPPPDIAFIANGSFREVAMQHWGDAPISALGRACFRICEQQAEH
jgi:hypothetical protein